MAIVTAVKSGNWSDPTVWSTGSLPQMGDTARPGAYAVVIDQNVDLGEGALEGTPGATGYFRVNVPEIEIRCSYLRNTNAPLLQLYHTSGQVRITAEIRGGSVPSQQVIVVWQTGGLMINGDLSAGSQSITYALWDRKSGAASLPFIINGNVYGGSGQYAYGILLGTSRRMEINGNLYGGQYLGASYAVMMSVYYADLGGLHVTGDVIASTTSAALYASAVYGPTYVQPGQIPDIIIYGDVWANEYGAGQMWIPGIIGPELSFPIVVHGSLHDGPTGAPAIIGMYCLDKRTPRAYVDLPYIDPATDEIILQRYRAGVNPQLTATVQLRSQLTSTI